MEKHFVMKEKFLNNNTIRQNQSVELLRNKMNKIKRKVIGKKENLIKMFDNLSRVFLIIEDVNLLNCKNLSNLRYYYIKINKVIIII